MPWGESSLALSDNYCGYFLILLSVVILFVYYIKYFSLVPVIVKSETNIFILSTPVQGKTGLFSPPYS